MHGLNRFDLEKAVTTTALHPAPAESTHSAPPGTRPAGQSVRPSSSPAS